MIETAIEITYKDFKALMERRNHDADELVDLFRGKIEEPRQFFDRVMSCHWRNPRTGRYEDRSDVVIPYRSVIAFYQQEVHYLQETPSGSATECAPAAAAVRCSIGRSGPLSTAGRRAIGNRSRTANYRLVSSEFH